MAKILIVDDEPRIRELLRENLQYAGYACEEAGDGSAALSLLSGGGYRSGDSGPDDALHGRHDLPARDAQPPHQHSR